jgi:hypothetical protein
MHVRRRVNWLRVTSGKDAMSLLLTSERVFADMIDWLHYGEPEQVCQVCGYVLQESHPFPAGGSQAVRAGAHA